MPSRLLHTMLRVNDLDKAIEFYTKVLGMQLVRYREFPEASFSLAFLGYGMLYPLIIHDSYYHQIQCSIFILCVF